MIGVVTILLRKEIPVEKIVIRLSIKIKLLLIKRLIGVSVPRAGIEPARYCYHWILNPARLPIPPSRPKRMSKIL